MNAFSRSWKVTKMTFKIMREDKELLMFPVLASIFSILFLVAMVFPAIFTSALTPDEGAAASIVGYGLLFLIYLGLSFIATFFNVCVVYTTKTRMEGGNATVGSSLSFAFGRIHLIFMWALLSATVGTLLRAIENIAERFGVFGQLIVRITTSIIGMLWAIATIFVIPAMVYHNVSPFKAIKQSVATLKKTWGESLIRYFGLGMMQFLFYIVGVALTFALIVTLSPLGGYGFLTAILIAAVYFVLVTIIFGLATTIFNTILYVYADQGVIPDGYENIVKDAFHNKQKKGFLG